MLRTGTIVPFITAIVSVGASVLAEPVPVLVVRTHGAAALSAEGPDAGVRGALAMLPARVAELPGEAPNMPHEAAGLIRAVLGAVARPATLTVMYDPMNVAGGMFGYGVALSVECEGEADAALVHSMIERGIRGGPILGPPQASAEFEGMEEVWTSVALVRYGPRRVGDTVHYEMHIGSVADPEACLGALPAPMDAPGYQPVAAMVMDLSGLTPAATIARSLPGPQAPQMAMVVSRLASMGLVGEQAMRITMQGGVAEDAAHTRTIVHGAGRFREALGMSSKALTADDLRVVPADAHFASIGTIDLGIADRIMADLAASGAPVEHAIAEVRRATGIDPVGDVLHALGGSFAVYTSDATGAGSILSIVAAVGVSDAERMRETRAKLAGLVNGVIARQDERAGMYIRVEPWAYGGDEYWSVRVRGLPVPVELTCAITDEWLIVAPSAQAAVAAVRQATGRGDAGLGSNPGFAAALDAAGGPAVAASFVDPERTLRAGYPALVLAGTALGNMVRSPHGDARDPGLIVPPYHDLRRGALPSVDVSWWDGDDFVTSSTGDPSALVRVGGVIGAGAPLMPIVAVAAVSGAARNGRVGLLDGGTLTGSVSALAAWGVLGDPLSRAVVLLALTGGYATVVECGPDAILPSTADAGP